MPAPSTPSHSNHTSPVDRFNQASTLFDRGDTEAALTIWRRLLSENPTNVALYHNLGIGCRRGQYLAESEAVLRAGIARFPQAWELWLALGFTLLEWTAPARALMAFTRALELQPQQPRCHYAVSVALIQEAERLRETGITNPPSSTNTELALYKDAAAHLAMVLEHQPRQVGAHYMAARVSLALGKPEAAQEHLTLCVTFEPTHSAGWDLLRYTQRINKQWRDGFSPPTPASARRTPQRLQGGLDRWQGEPLRSRGLLVHTGHLNDPHQPQRDPPSLSEVIFLLRFLRGLPSSQTIAQVPYELVSVVRRARLCGAVVAQPISDPDPNDPPVSTSIRTSHGELPKVQVALSDLPALLLAQDTDIQPYTEPYLSPDPVLAGIWRRLIEQRLPQQLPIAISWHGQPHASGVPCCFPLLAMSPLAESLEDAAFIAVQHGGSRLDLPLSVIFADHLANDPQLTDYDYHADPLTHTLAILNSCALVITCDNIIAHLAAAMGKPTWVAAAADGDWAFTHTQPSDAGDPSNVWYPTAELFRKTPHILWRDVFSRMARVLIPLRSSATD